MTSANENLFLDRIQSALKVSSNTERRFSSIFPAQNKNEARQRIKLITGRKKEDQQKLLEKLTKAGKPINLKVIPIENMDGVTKKIKALIIEKTPEWGHEKKVAIWQHPLIDQLHLPFALKNEEVCIHQSSFPNNLPKIEARQQIRDKTAASFIGITSADYCVAESATLVIETQPGQARATSLLPSIHIAVIRVDQIIANLNELYTLLTQAPDFNRQGLTNCLTFISGPSKTADIEAVMVHGAHGPREMYLLVITSKSM